MELWIRSQDRKRLENVYSLCLFEISNGKETRYVIENIDCLIAEYKTEERALEVLDEIQNIIIGKYMTNLSFEASFSKFDDEEEARKTLIAMAVYEMPKE